MPWSQVLFFILLLVVIAPFLGRYIAAVFQGQKTVLQPILGGLERLTYRIGGVDPNSEMSWQGYAKALFLFNFIGVIAVFLLQLFQNLLPLNPQNFPAVEWSLALNTAISFVTNTNWQAYAGETTLSYTTQMLGLAVQNFLSAATGGCALIALIRGFTSKTEETIGNFWKDLVRQIVYLFLPLSILFACVLVAEGMIQNFSSYVEVQTLEGVKQMIPQGPVASQIAIKQLGTNGGGFFNTNSAHPFENPSALSNFLEQLAILMIPAALVFTYGRMLGSKKQGWLLFGVMFFLWAVGLAISFYSQSLSNPVLEAMPVLEGQETRFGTANSLLWSVSTTATANGSVNAMLSSLAPLAGAVCMFNLMVGELIFGGVGVGMCSMIMYVLLTVFLSGLMIGRTPEYFGKKIEKREMQWVMVGVLTQGVLILIGAGISSVLPQGLAGLSNQGPHGLSEILYAFSSTAGNNGSAFAGLNANTLYYNLFLGVVMLLARVAIIVPSLAVAGLVAQKKTTPPSAGTFSADTLLFALLLVATILIIGALTFSPAQVLGPIVEHFLMIEGRSF